MKALTLHQPWAALIAVGVKTIETRSWPTSYRGPLAIHAAALPVIIGSVPLHVREAAAKYRMDYGAVVATCELVDCHPIVGDGDLIELSQPYVAWWSGAPPGSPPASLHIWEEDEAIETITAQAPFGNFTPGRFAWVLEDVRALQPPVPARGAQRLWNWSNHDPR